MNRAETYDLLTAIALVDNRKFDDATVLMWHQILGHINPTDAGHAVAEHFRSSDAYLMPVHIARLADGYAKTRNHRDRIQAQVIEASPATTVEERSPEVTAALTQLRGTLPASNPDRLRWGARLWGRRDRAERGGAPVRAFGDDARAHVAARILAGTEGGQQ
jgi:hypothetical protein